MNTNNDLIYELQDFMFNEENIKSYLSIRNEYFKEKQEKQTENSADNYKEKKEKKEEKKKSSMYFPGQQDSLFWCY